MKSLVIGLGSMGKRRIRNLKHLGMDEIVGFDPRTDRCAEAQSKYGIPTVTGFEEALAMQPDIFIISTPPDLHMPYMREAAQRNRHFFCEAGVSTEGLDALLDLCRGKNLVAAPSCTLRFQPSIKKIKEVVDSGQIGKILSFTYHSGQYLPDWHPWESIKDFYVGKRETGGCREILPFELVWLTWLLGDVTAISCFKGKLSRLEVDIDDIYQVLLEFSSGTLGHIQVDVVARLPYRTCRLISETGIIEWDQSAKHVRVYNAAEGSWTTHPEPEPIVEPGYVASENMYIDEMRCFLDAVHYGKPYPYSLAEDGRILSLLAAAEESAAHHRHVFPKAS